MQPRRFAYIGAYGRKHRPAYVPAVGYLYYQEVVELDMVERLIRFTRIGVEPVPLTDEAMRMLEGPEFQSANSFCEHKDAAGQFCQNVPEEGQTKCRFHRMIERHAAGPAEPANVKPGEAPKQPEVTNPMRDFADGLATIAAGLTDKATLVVPKRKRRQVAE